MTNQNTIAETILQQLGGNRFIAMTGARGFLATENGLRFKLPRGAAKKSINFVQIVLEQNDLYSVTFGTVRGVAFDVVEEQGGLYWDQLQAIFTRVTGLDCTL